MSAPAGHFERGALHAHDIAAEARRDETFVTWDEGTRRGALSRDRSGRTPVLLATDGPRLAFAADVPELVRQLGKLPEPDVAGVAGWLAHGMAPPGRTLLAGVRRLAPGTHLELGPDGVTEHVHWSPRFEEPIRDPAEARIALRDALDAAVARTASPDAALLLSGGLDSTAVAALSPAPRPLALHAAFPGDPGVDETPIVDATVAQLGLAGLRLLVDEPAPLAAAVDHSRRWLAPLGTPNEPLWSALLGAAAQRGARVVLDGEGGDTVLGGAPFFVADLLRSGHPRAAHAAARALVGPALARRALWRYGVVGAAPYALHQRLRRRSTPAWLAPEAARALAEAHDPWAFKRLDGPRWWAQRAHELSVLLDASGAHDLPRRRALDAGMEERHPLQDPELIATCLRLHPDLLHDASHDRPLARDALAGAVPDHVLRRTEKAFFNAAQERWLVAETPGRAELLGPDALLGAFVELDAVRRWALGAPDRHPYGRARWAVDAWRVAAMEIWLRVRAGRNVGLPASTATRAGAIVSIGAE